MARYTVVFDREAQADLRDIRDHVAKARDADFAEAFVRRVVLYCESLGLSRIGERSATPSGKA